MTDANRIFDWRLLRLHRDRAARGAAEPFLFREVALRLAERLMDVNRVFPLALDLGSRDGALAAALAETGRVDCLLRADPSPVWARRDGDGFSLACDPARLPFAEASFDLVVSGLLLHWTDDLPGALAGIRHVLKPDGLFLAALFADGTLAELKDCLLRAEIALSGGAAPRIAPLADLRALGGVLQTAGFALPVADREDITVWYQDPARLLEDLRAMGETAPFAAPFRRRPHRDLFSLALQMYRQDHADTAGRVPATFRLAWLHGWRPADSQPKALRPGSGKVSLATVLGMP